MEKFIYQINGIYNLVIEAKTKEEADKVFENWKNDR